MAIGKKIKIELMPKIYKFNIILEVLLMTCTESFKFESKKMK